jgi:hypothetical protein
MLNKLTYVAAFLAAGLSGAAAITPSAAQGVRPIEYKSIDLGPVAGDVYYTVRPDGFHVVATFAPRGENTVPVRFQAVLTPGQTITFSTPRQVGLPPIAVQILRRNDQVLVHQAALTD